MFQWKNLDSLTRGLMLDEISIDVASGTLYYGKRLTDVGRLDYQKNLLDAVKTGDETTLAAQLRRPGQLKTKELRGNSLVDVARNAPEQLAEGEFNRFYIRAICRRAIDAELDEVIVYRAKAATEPRPASEARIGAAIDPHRLLKDLRSNPGVETALGVPGGPNSGMSVHLP